MKTLIILRHAKAEPAAAQQTDHARVLAPRGLRDAMRMGQWLEEHELTPELILSSTAARARETTAQVLQVCRFNGRAEFLDNLYLAAPAAYLSALETQAAEFARVMLVGHNPGLEDLVQLLTHQHLLLPTAGLAVVTLPIEHWSELDHSTKHPLAHFLKPKEM